MNAHELARIHASSFERGWAHALARFRDGLTWESITHEADERAAVQAYEFSRGMVAAVDAMSGWLDLARREARAHGIAPSMVEALIGGAQ